MISPGAVQSTSHLGQSGEVGPGAQDLGKPVVSEPGAEAPGYHLLLIPGANSSPTLREQCLRECGAGEAFRHRVLDRTGLSEPPV